VSWAMIAMRARCGSAGGFDVAEEFPVRGGQELIELSVGHLAGGGCLSLLLMAASSGESCSRRVHASGWYGLFFLTSRTRCWVIFSSRGDVCCGGMPSRSKAITVRASLVQRARRRPQHQLGLHGEFLMPGAGSGQIGVAHPRLVRRGVCGILAAGGARRSATVRIHASLPVIACQRPGSLLISFHDSIKGLLGGVLRVCLGCPVMHYEPHHPVIVGCRRSRSTRCAPARGCQAQGPGGWHMTGTARLVPAPRPLTITGRKVPARVAATSPRPRPCAGRTPSPGREHSRYARTVPGSGSMPLAPCRPHR